MSGIAYVFPGQGSQAVGMGKSLFDKYDSARAVFVEADKILQYPISKLCFEGPVDELINTINVQPAIFTTSIACLEVAREITNDTLKIPDFVAGHSLGEYTALYTAGVLNFRDTLLLVRERGRLMNQSGREKPGGMVAIIGAELNILEEISVVSGTQISNINCPGQIVLSGSSESLEKAKGICLSKGIRRIIPLNVSGAFHSKLMESAAGLLQREIKRYEFNNAKIPIIANVTGERISSGQDIKDELVNQILKCVQWQKSIENMIKNGIKTFIEFGHGHVLTNLIKRINNTIDVFNIDDNSIEVQVKNIFK